MIVDREDTIISFHFINLTLVIIIWRYLYLMEDRLKIQLGAYMVKSMELLICFTSIEEVNIKLTWYYATQRSMKVCNKYVIKFPFLIYRIHSSKVWDHYVFYRIQEFKIDLVENFIVERSVNENEIFIHHLCNWFRINNNTMLTVDS